MKRRTVFLLLALLPLALLAQGLPPPPDPADYLGMDLKALFEAMGVPLKVEPFRGPEAWQDDVVFRYAGGLSFFIYKDRVWQVRFEKDYPGSVYGLAQGDSPDKAKALLGPPEGGEGDSLYFRRPDRGYPVRLRVLLAEGRVSDIYLYRADF